jgi:hypothetical protein
MLVFSTGICHRRLRRAERNATFQRIRPSSDGWKQIGAREFKYQIKIKVSEESRVQQQALGSSSKPNIKMQYLYFIRGFPSPKEHW